MLNFSLQTNRYKTNSHWLFETIGAVTQQMAIFKKSNRDKNKLFQFVFVAVFFLLCHAPCSAQVTDTISSTKNLQTKNSSIGNETNPTDKPTTKPKKHSPKMAALMSTVIPGLGQAYNKKYWKVPVIYAGFTGLIYSFSFNQSQYVTFLDAYKFRLEGGLPANSNYPNYSDQNLNDLQQYYKRYRNLSVIGMSLLYLMNIVDASVDAHMFTFDVGDNLSFNIHPTLINTTYVNRYTNGLSLSIRF